MFCRHNYRYTQGHFYCTKCGHRTYNERTSRKNLNKKWIIIGIITTIIVVSVAGFGLFTGDNSNAKNIAEDKRTPSEDQIANNKQVSDKNQITETAPTTYTSLPIIYRTFHPHPIIPLMPLQPEMIPLPYRPNSEELEQYNLKKAEYDLKFAKYEKKLEQYNLKKAEYDKAMKEYKTSQITTVSYGGGSFRTDELELQIHKLINEERKKKGLASLAYDYQISNIAHNHSSDMSINDYFAHEDLKGVSPAERGYVYGYSSCGDRKTIQLADEYDQLFKQFESTGNTDVAMYNQLQKMKDQLNSAIDQGMIFGGLSENIFQNSLYSQYWTTNGAITSYDWTSPEEIARSTVNGWMNSTGHRQNILTPYYASEGIGVEISSDYTVYITQNFC